MNRLLSSISLVAIGLSLGACLGGEEATESTTTHELRPRGRMFATQRAPYNVVPAYDADGTQIATLTGAGVTVPFGVHVEGDSVYVVSQATNSVYVHRHRGPHTPDTLVELVPPGSGGLTNPFYPTVRDDKLYVSSHDTDQVLRYNARTGAFIDVFVAAGAGGLDGPRGLDFDSSGNLYVASSINGKVLVYNRWGTFVKALASDVATVCGVSIDHDRICVGSAGGTGVHCFTRGGAKFYASGTGRVCGVDHGPDGHLYATRPDLNTVEEHDYVNPPTTFLANVPAIAAVSWGDDGRWCDDGDH